MRRLSEKLSRKKFAPTHRYVGPSNGFGLREGTLFVLVSRIKSHGQGLVTCEDIHGGRWSIRHDCLEAL